jgi:peptidylprolyl isomerase
MRSLTALTLSFLAACTSEAPTHLKPEADPGSTRETAADFTADPTPTTDPVVLRTEDRGDGLLVDILVEGEGDVCRAGDLILCHYTGTLAADGTEFDSSRKRGEPLSFPLGRGRVIKGWDRGFAGLAIGTRAILHIPADLAYGAGGRGSIPSAAALDFEIEVVDIVRVRVEILLEGTGPAAARGQEVVVHYTGRLADGGKQFDSSRDSNHPFRFRLGAGRVIQGWEMGFDGMKVGTKAVLHIPSALGYGARGAGAAIPPDADLEFDVELLEVH